MGVSEELVLNVVSAITNISFYCFRGKAGSAADRQTAALMARVVKALMPVLKHSNPEVGAYRIPLVQSYSSHWRTW